MYSPRIDPSLIPELYRWRLELGIPMTWLVNAILGLAVHNRKHPRPACICPGIERSHHLPPLEVASHDTED